ncbi:MAG: hypothetical protein ACWA5Q_05935 [bacterium]
MRKLVQVFATVGFLGFCVFFATVGLAAEVGSKESIAEQEAHKLIDRVQGRWDALIDQDFKGAWEFETPGYKAAYDWKQYRAKFGMHIAWTGARVHRVEVHEDLVANPVAKVLVKVKYVALLAVESDEKIESERVLSEKWLKEGDQWYHLQE